MHVCTVFAQDCIFCYENVKEIAFFLCHRGHVFGAFLGLYIKEPTVSNVSSNLCVQFLHRRAHWHPAVSSPCVVVDSS